jgi:hypothetical protein
MCLGRFFGMKYELNQATLIAQVNEYESAMIATTMDPTGDPNRLAGSLRV